MTSIKYPIKYVSSDEKSFEGLTSEELEKILDESFTMVNNNNESMSLKEKIQFLESKYDLGRDGVTSHKLLIINLINLLRAEYESINKE